MSALLPAFALMTALAVAAVLWPVFRRPRLPERQRFELSVYRDQLDEIDRDLARGLIAPEEARAARLEIERRLLRATGASEAEAATAGGSPRPVAVFLAAVLLPILATGLYAWLGAPDLPDQPLYARTDRQPQPDQQAPNIPEMVARLENRLAQNPNDLEGWLMLGRSKVVMGDVPAAVNAYRRAQTMAPDDPRVLASLGEMLVMSTDGIVTPEARSLFTRLLQQRPDEPRAAYYLGWADAQAGDYKAALDRWRALLAVTPADAPWRERVVEAVRTAAGELQLDPAAVLAEIPTPPPAAAPPAAAPSVAGMPTRTPGPSQEDVARAAQMSPDDRMAMIRGMVDKLAARLEADGSDVEGWRRLAQARGVLGETDQVKATYEKALALHPNDPGLLKGYAATLLGPVRSDTGLPEIGDRAAELFAKAASLQPDDPEPLWYLGIRALQEGRKDEARARWQKVLTQLDPGQPEYAMIKGRLEQLGG